MPQKRPRIIHHWLVSRRLPERRTAGRRRARRATPFAWPREGRVAHGLSCFYSGVLLRLCASASSFIAMRAIRTYAAPEIARSAAVDAITVPPELADYIACFNFTMISHRIHAWPAADDARLPSSTRALMRPVGRTPPPQTRTILHDCLTARSMLASQINTVILASVPTVDRRETMTSPITPIVAVHFLAPCRLLIIRHYIRFAGR